MDEKQLQRAVEEARAVRESLNHEEHEWDEVLNDVERTLRGSAGQLDYLLHTVHTEEPGVRDAVRTRRDLIMLAADMVRDLKTAFPKLGNS